MPMQYDGYICSQLVISYSPSLISLSTMTFKGSQHWNTCNQLGCSIWSRDLPKSSTAAPRFVIPNALLPFCLTASGANVDS